MLPRSLRHKFNLGLAFLLQKPMNYDLIFRQGVLLTTEMRGISCVFFMLIENVTEHFQAWN